ncbi:hypothetical protein PC9H_004251 [Pleurotus ostreatus]|uniref:Aminoglycoside phosphotransferase domain-containing protein n=1 Tax=Pleurotus ostreatus TaxID=5322 RepID=A0A8H7A2H5_PLEOS|nr:uncharacterized protein PC9H_004251 [Pleurotus ostreatus]KAF7437412.1 hypothetical protein PC9H_004251 [Pleurotus ostreatus]
MSSLRLILSSLFLSVVNEDQVTFDPKPNQFVLGSTGRFAFAGMKLDRLRDYSEPPCGLDAVLTLNGITRNLTLVSDQGNTAITYSVDGGWPPPGSTTNEIAYAKSGKTPGQTFTDEIKWLGKIHQLFANGSFNNRNWIVFQGVANKVHITATTYFATVLLPYLLQGNVDACKTQFKNNKIPLIVAQAKYYVDTFQVLHTDLQPGNILWDMQATAPTLIDWGSAKEVLTWTIAVAAEVTAQVEFSHLTGSERICVSLA